MEGANNPLLRSHYRLKSRRTPNHGIQDEIDTSAIRSRTVLQCGVERLKDFHNNSDDLEQMTGDVNRWLKVT